MKELEQASNRQRIRMQSKHGESYIAQLMNQTHSKYNPPKYSSLPLDIETQLNNLVTALESWTLNPTSKRGRVAWSQEHGEGGITSSTVDDINGLNLLLIIIELGGATVRLGVWDTSGHPRSRLLIRPHYQEAMGVPLVYDISQHSTFDNISSWIRDFRGHTDPDKVVNMVLVGNKVDVSEGVVDRVDASMGQELADECRIRFFENSGKTKYNVKVAFEMLAWDIKQRLASGSGSDLAVFVVNRSRPKVLARESYISECSVSVRR